MRENNERIRERVLSLSEVTTEVEFVIDVYEKI